ncbi:hypothetical protein HMI54_012170 [Coelomomyces lativittatus]|nr:hypothetical protein HMI54_012170 [Coelomomyces lativittatus]
MPLDLLIHSFTQAIHSTGGPSSSFSTSFTYSSTHVIGLGLRGDPPTHLKEKCWLYFPESNCPFYRVTVFSNYSPHLVPTHRALPTLRKVDPTLPFHSTPSVSPYWSLMFEVSESNYKPVHGATLLEETIQGAFNTDLVTKDMEIVCMYHRRFEHGYPTPTLDRDSILTQWLPNLESMNIFSRGRFGSWKYEVGNQDHSFMLGVEAVDRVLFGIPEYTLLHPNIVNQRQNHERKLVHSSLFTFKPGNGYGIPSKSLDKEDEKVLQKKSHVVRNQEICERS